MRKKEKTSMLFNFTYYLSIKSYINSYGQLVLVNLRYHT